MVQDFTGNWILHETDSWFCVCLCECLDKSAEFSVQFCVRRFRVGLLITLSKTSWCNIFIIILFCIISNHLSVSVEVDWLFGRDLIACISCCFQPNFNNFVKPEEKCEGKWLNVFTCQSSQKACQSLREYGRAGWKNRRFFTSWEGDGQCYFLLPATQITVCCFACKQTLGCLV